MNARFENTALAIAGCSLLVATFAGLSLFAREPATSKAPRTPREQAAAVTARAWDAFDEAPERPPLRAELDLLGSWSLPAPYTADELRELVAELERGRDRVHQREEELARRAELLDERQATVEARLRELTDLQARLDRELPPPLLGGDGLEREPAPVSGPAPERAPTAGRWTEIARLLGALPVEDAKHLLARYGPEDAAEILRALDDAQHAAELLAALRTVPSVREWKSYVDAYSVLDEGAGD